MQERSRGAAFTKNHRRQHGSMSTPCDIRVRVARPHDAEEVTALLQSSYPALLAPDYDADLLARALPLMCRANPALLGSGTYYIAETDHAMIGCGGWTMERPGRGAVVPGEGHIRHFGTVPSAVRGGVATRIMRRCFEDARGAGIRVFHCYATRAAVPFYAAMGFITIGPIDVPLADDLAFPSVLMRHTW